jgi:nicotinate-nucleotide adenylyltransferase
MTARRIGILGGTFDPIHCGHLDMAAAADAALGLTRLYFIPANTPPHRTQPHASSFHRFAMVALAVAGHPRWRSCDLELRVDAASPSYTTTTLQRFLERGYGPGELFFVIGTDAFAEIATWKDYPRILERANFAVVSRPGCSVEEVQARLPHLASRMTRTPLARVGEQEPVIILIDAPTADVSSTAIRQRRAERAAIAGLVPPGVAQHIEQHELYAPRVPGRRGSES